jgi:hypothetical protein
VKVIGITSENHYHKEYICTVERIELEKYLGLYYSATNAKLPELKVGDTVDLGRAHDYASQIGSAMKQTQEFVRAHQQVVTAILNGLNYQRIAEVAAAEKTAMAVPLQVAEK